MKLLIVDDSENIQTAWRKFCQLIDQCKIVSESSNLDKAVKAVDKIKPDVIISNFRLENGTALDLLQRLGENKPMVIILSYYRKSMIKKACLEAGADYFLYKTNDFDRLRAILEAYSKQITGSE